MQCTTKSYLWILDKGLCKEFFFKKCEFFFGGKSSQNSSKPVLIFWSSTYNVYYVCALLKVVSYYDLKCSVHVVMGFQKKVCMGGGWVGSALSKFFEFFEFV